MQKLVGQPRWSPTNIVNVVSESKCFLFCFYSVQYEKIKDMEQLLSMISLSKYVFHTLQYLKMCCHGRKMCLFYCDNAASYERLLDCRTPIVVFMFTSFTLFSTIYEHVFLQCQILRLLAREWSCYVRSRLHNEALWTKFNNSSVWMLLRF